jgi:hypothetical protein
VDGHTPSPQKCPPTPHRGGRACGDPTPRTARSGHDRYRLERVRIRVQQALHDPKLKKAYRKLLKLAKKNAKKIDEAAHAVSNFSPIAGIERRNSLNRRLLPQSTSSTCNDHLSST